MAKGLRSALGLALLTAAGLGLEGCAASVVVGVQGAQAHFAEQERERWMPLAEQGDPEAQFLVGKTHCCGFGPFFHTNEAIRWYCRAARQGHPRAHFELGNIHAGRLPADDRLATIHRQPDLVTAHMWYHLAYAQGHSEAVGALTEIEREMSPEEIAAAHDRYAEWRSFACEAPVGGARTTPRKGGSVDKDGGGRGPPTARASGHD